MLVLGEKKDKDDHLKRVKEKLLTLSYPTIISLLVSPD